MLNSSSDGKQFVTDNLMDFCKGSMNYQIPLILKLLLKLFTEISGNNSCPVDCFHTVSNKYSKLVGLVLLDPCGYGMSQFLD